VNSKLSLAVKLNGYVNPCSRMFDYLWIGNKDADKDNEWKLNTSSRGKELSGVGWRIISPNNSSS